MKVVDMHCDTIAEIYYNHNAGGNISIKDCELRVNLEKMKKGDYLLQNFALFTDISREKEPLEYAMKLVDVFNTELEKYPDMIGIVKSYADIEDNIKKGRMSALMTVEEGAVCQGELSYLRDYHRLGVRMMTIVWNYKNELGYPNRTVNIGTSNERMYIDTENGLTDKGIEFLHEMERIGIIIDVSHLNDAGINDVIKYTKKPFVASHSNARGVCPHPRNLSDDMIKSISQKGGVIGINYYPEFLRLWEDNIPMAGKLEDVIEHMKYIRNIGGTECLGLGSDFDGYNTPSEPSDTADMQRLADAMKKSGFSESEIEAVFYKNVLRVYKELLV